MAQTHVLIDESIEIADDDGNDVLVSEGQFGEVRSSNSAAVSRSDLRIKVRMKLAGMLNKKNYSEQTVVEHSSEDEWSAIEDILRQFSTGVITAEEAQKSIAVYQASLDTKVKHEISDYVAVQKEKDN